MNSLLRNAVRPQSFLNSSQPLSRGFHATAARATTILCVRKNGKVCMMGDGMVSQGSMIVKANTKKIRVMKETTLVGFAGSTADAFTLLDRLEGKLDEYPGQLTRAAVELAKGWRTDKYLRRLEASIVVADANVSLEVTGNGDVLESVDGILGVGSGSPYAIAAARALKDIPELSAEDVAKRAMAIASNMCVHTNDTYVTEIVDEVKEEDKEE